MKLVSCESSKPCIGVKVSWEEVLGIQYTKCMFWTISPRKAAKEVHKGERGESKNINSYWPFYLFWEKSKGWEIATFLSAKATLGLDCTKGEKGKRLILFLIVFVMCTQVLHTAINLSWHVILHGILCPHKYWKKPVCFMWHTLKVSISVEE